MGIKKKNRRLETAPYLAHRSLSVSVYLMNEGNVEESNGQATG